MARPPAFKISTEEAGGMVSVGLEGELDLATAPELERELERVRGLDGLERIVVDLRSLAFLDSTGLEAIVKLHTLGAAAGVEVTVVRGPRAVERLFAVMQLDRTLRIVDDPADAG
jgi:anti-anti-sigma factor